MLATIRIFVKELRHARVVKGHLIKQAQTDPRDFLKSYAALPAADQQYLCWLKKIAESNLTN